MPCKQANTHRLLKRSLVRLAGNRRTPALGEPPLHEAYTFVLMSELQNGVERVEGTEETARSPTQHERNGAVFGVE